MISAQASTHSSQMNTLGPAINCRTPSCGLAQKEHRRFVSCLSALLVRLDMFVCPTACRSAAPRRAFFASRGNATRLGRRVRRLHRLMHLFTQLLSKFLDGNHALLF